MILAIVRADEWFYPSLEPGSAPGGAGRGRLGLTSLITSHPFFLLFLVSFTVMLFCDFPHFSPGTCAFPTSMLLAFIQDVVS